MNPFREALLWASKNQALAGRVPRLGFVRASVTRFMPGETMEEALRAADGLAARGLPTTFTHLGENVASAPDADAVEQQYADLLERIAERGLDTEISVKPTHLGLDLGIERMQARLAGLAERAAQHATWLWLDMESSEYVAATVEAYRRLRAAFPNTGICLQAYLRRTPQDVADLLPLDASIRLVKGAYREPPQLALHGRSAIDEQYRRLAVAILRRTRGEAGRLAVGTHDVDLVERIEADVAADGLDRTSFEVQMLYGIRAADQVRLSRSGHRVRVLIAYGPHWYPWFMRRLAEKPTNVLTAMRNLLSNEPAR